MPGPGPGQEGVAGQGSGQGLGEHLNQGWDRVGTSRGYIPGSGVRRIPGRKRKDDASIGMWLTDSSMV